MNNKLYTSTHHRKFLKLLTVFLLVVGGLRLQAQTVFWGDNFDAPASCTNNAGVGWIVAGPMDADDGSYCTNSWHIGNTTKPNGICTTGNKLYVWAGGSFGCNGNKDTYDSDNNSDIFAISPKISTVGVTNITMTFDWRDNGSGSGGQDFGTIGFSNDGGNTFTWQTTPYEGTSTCQTGTVINVPALYDGIANFVIGFQYVSNATSCALCDPPFNIDNILLKGTVSSCPSIASQDSTNPTCVSPNTGTITIVAGGCGDTYYINGGTLDSNTTGQFTNLPTGNYTVAVGNGSCVTQGSTMHLTAPGAPSAPVASYNPPLCAGSTLQLSATTVVGATSYSWTGPNGYTSAQQNPAAITNVIAADSGNYIVRASGGGCSSPPDTIHVVIGTIAPPIATNTGPYCAGATMQLKATTIAGATYNWTGPNNFPNQQNPSKANITVADSGDYQVIVTVGSCSSTAATTHVSVVPSLSPPVLQANTPCVGDSLIITASNAGSNYAWTGPNHYNSNAQNPVILNASYSDTGYYVVAVTSGSCSAPLDSVHVSVNAAPAAPDSATSNTPVCSGSTLDLFAANVPGASYSWSGPNSFTSGQQNPTIPNATAANSGTYNVYAYIGNCKSTSVSAIVSVGTAPALTGAHQVNTPCSGGTLMLAAPAVPNATYNWTGPNSYSDTAQNPAITDVSVGAAGIYQVVAHFGNCTSAPDTVNVTIHPTPLPPVLSAPFDTICSSDSVQVCAPDTFTTYVWSTHTSTTNCTQVKEQGGVWVTVTDANNCSVESQHKNIYAYQVSDVSIDLKGDTLYTQPANGYQWYLGNTAIPGATNINYIVTQIGVYYVVIIDINGCPNSSSTVNVSKLVGINEVNGAFNLSVYPNPASGSFNVVYSGLDNKNMQLNIYNILGEGVKQENLSFNNGKNKVVDISSLPKGVYMLQFTQQGGQTLTKKLVVQ